MRRSVRIGLLGSGLASLGLLGAASPAPANLATIGSALDQPSDANSCLAPCIAVQQGQVAGSPNPLTSPANGIVTKWAIVTTDNVVFGLRILRPTGPGTYVGAGTAVAPTQDPNGPDNRLVLRYPASLPISQGDAIGVYATGGDSDVGVPQHNTPGVGSNIWATNPLGTPADGASASFTPESGHELLLQATSSSATSRTSSDRPRPPPRQRSPQPTAPRRRPSRSCG